MKTLIILSLSMRYTETSFNFCCKMAFLYSAVQGHVQDIFDGLRYRCFYLQFIGSFTTYLCPLEGEGKRQIFIQGGSAPRSEHYQLYRVFLKGKAFLPYTCM